VSTRAQADAQAERSDSNLCGALYSDPCVEHKRNEDMQQGLRKGIWSELMKPAVTKLTAEDRGVIAADIASRKPSRGSARVVRGRKWYPFYSGRIG
jgi:hypothetical protein